MRSVHRLERMFAPRPTSLLDVSRLTLAGSGYAPAVKEFIDHLIGVSRWIDGKPLVPIAAYQDAPEHLDDAIPRAHLGGLAEHLSRLAGRDPPPWCDGPAYFMDQPVLPAGRPRPDLAETTPAPFRRRNLFCGPVLQKLHAGRR